jgi:hypothetical protein
VRHVRMLGLCLIAAFALSAFAAGSAVAKTKPPVDNLKVYKECPTEGSNGGHPVEICVVATTEKGEGAGHYTVGTITVPLAKPVELEYGLAFNQEIEQGQPGHELYVAAANGETLPPTKELVPGEPIGNITAAEQEEMGWPEALKTSYAAAQAKGQTSKIYETIELAGTPETNREKLLEEEGTAVEAPVKIKGENKWLTKLGDKCYIGSNEEPIVQHLTSGSSTSPLTNETITGAVGELEFGYEFQAVAITHDDLVDNTYPVPGASCKGPFAKYINATIDKVFGIPAVAGASVTELKGTLYNADVGLVERELGL